MLNQNAKANERIEMIKKLKKKAKHEMPPRYEAITLSPM
jgi:hypothetical protein